MDCSFPLLVAATAEQHVVVYNLSALRRRSRLLLPGSLASLARLSQTTRPCPSERSSRPCASRHAPFRATRTLRATRSARPRAASAFSTSTRPSRGATLASSATARNCRRACRRSGTSGRRRASRCLPSTSSRSTRSGALSRRGPTARSGAPPLSSFLLGRETDDRHARSIWDHMSKTRLKTLEPDRGRASRPALPVSSRSSGPSLSSACLSQPSLRPSSTAQTSTSLVRTRLSVERRSRSERLTACLLDADALSYDWWVARPSLLNLRLDGGLPLVCWRVQARRLHGQHGVAADQDPPAPLRGAFRSPPTLALPAEARTSLSGDS